MNKGYVAVLGLMVAGLVGCASKPAPQFVDQDYVQTALHWHAIHQCAMNGEMDADTAALGRRYVQGILAQHQYDQSRLNHESEKLRRNQQQVTREDCRILAISIHETRQKIALQNENTALQQRSIDRMIDQINSTRSTQTHCMNIGGIISCNSF